MAIAFNQSPGERKEINISLSRQKTQKSVFVCIQIGNLDMELLSDG